MLGTGVALLYVSYGEIMLTRAIKDLYQCIILLVDGWYGVTAIKLREAGSIAAL